VINSVSAKSGRKMLQISRGPRVRSENWCPNVSTGCVTSCDTP